MVRSLEFSSEVLLPTHFGNFKCFAVKEHSTAAEHFVLYKGTIKDKVCLVRVQSECLTGEVFHSLKCDCGRQLEQSLQMISKCRSGVLIYLRQEGRNIGLFNKIEAYKNQELGMDTVDANLELGLPIDDRSYHVAAKILKRFAPKAIKLITNNPDKIKDLQTTLGIPIKRIVVNAEPNKFNLKYLKTKVTKLNHLIKLK